MAGNQDSPDDEEFRGRRRRIIVAGVLALLFLVGVNGAYRAVLAVQAGTRGKAALLRAERQLTDRRPKEARTQLVEARSSFRKARSELAAMGPLLPVARVVPFVRIQARGVQSFADAGVALADAGIGLSDSAAAIIEPSDQHRAVADALDALTGMQRSLDQGVAALRKANAKVKALDGYRLLGPIGQARNQLAARLPDVTARAATADRAIGALVAFAGGAGDRRYLFLSQNPDEARPTGGYMGTLGLLVAGVDGLKLDRFEPMENWLAAHPNAIVPVDQGPSALRLSYPPLPQTIANVNAAPDWPTAASLAAKLWSEGGETPVDGVVSVTPGFLSRILAVVGPVDVASFGETVTSANVRERFDFYTRQYEAEKVTGVTAKVRKSFVADLAQGVMQRLLTAPATEWEPLARVVGESFDNREALAWSTDAQVTAVLAERGWDGTLPVAAGDFFYGAEFQYGTKSGRALHRTYDHHVELRSDGSARVTTVITTRNPEPQSQWNDPRGVTYVTPYGPAGAALDPSSDKPVTSEAALAGHPSYGWFRGAPPLGQSTLKVVWEVPKLAVPNRDGSWTLPVQFLRLPDHGGDTLNLTVTLPEGWKWQGDPPPASYTLDRDLKGSWVIRP